jgi:hypothetical protein
MKNYPQLADGFDRVVAIDWLGFGGSSRVSNAPRISASQSLLDAASGALTSLLPMLQGSSTPSAASSSLESSGISSSYLHESSPRKQEDETRKAVDFFIGLFHCHIFNIHLC